MPDAVVELVERVMKLSQCDGARTLIEMELRDALAGERNEARTQVQCEIDTWLGPVLQQLERESDAPQKSGTEELLGWPSVEEWTPPTDPESDPVRHTP